MSEKISPVRVNELVRSPYRFYLDLNGEWGFKLDPDDIGEEKNFFSPDYQLDDTVRVPGCLDAQGKGLEHLPITEFDRWGGPDRSYTGVSWYRKTFQVPENLNNKKIFLNFGGVFTDCKVWLNGFLLGEHHFGSLPFGFEVGDFINPSGENTVVVKVENLNTHDLQDSPVRHTPDVFGTTLGEFKWSGIYRAVELTALNPSCISDIFLIPDINEGTFSCKYELAFPCSDALKGCKLRLKVYTWDDMKTAGQCEADADESGRGELKIKLDSPRFWSDADPFLYLVELALIDGSGEIIDSLSERTGLRDISFDGKFFRLNGVPVYLRGEMYHYHWPNTIAFPTDRKELRKGLSVYKQYGLNFIRHHTCAPPQEYLDVCDELGLLCHNELAVSCQEKESLKFPEEWLKQLWALNIKYDRNHPSVIIRCLGNEDYPSEEECKSFMELTWVLDKTRLLQSQSPGFILNQDGSRQRAPIFHELRNAGASYPDISIKKNYVAPLRSWRTMWIEEQTEKAGLAHLLPLFTRNTQLLQARSRKIILEELRLNSTLSYDVYDFRGTQWQGFELCNFRDSGSFMWGIVDDFFNPKIETPEEVRKYTGDTVLLWAHCWQERLTRYGKRPPLIMTFYCSHYGKTPVRDGVFEWEIIDSKGKKVLAGIENNINIECGELKLLLGECHELETKDFAEKMLMRVKLSFQDSVVNNQWDFWIFPWNHPKKYPVDIYAVKVGRFLKQFLPMPYICPDIELEPEKINPEGILITEKICDQLLEHLRNGGRALLLGEEHFPCEITDWSAGRSEFTRGTIIHDHPLMNGFPHQGWCDIPFSGMMLSDIILDGRRRGFSSVYDLSEFPDEFQPIIQAIPSFKAVNPKKLGFLFEVKVGLGKLLVSSFKFGYPLVNIHLGGFYCPAANFFFCKILRYMASGKFSPEITISENLLTKHK
jgi:hypothetical protein